MNAVAYCDGRVVAVGDDGVILLSKSGSDITGGFYRWAQEQGLDPAQIEPDTDPNAAGASYLEAYFFGLSPQALNGHQSRDKLPAITDELGVTFQAKAMTPDLEVIVERSTDLQVWSSVAGRIGLGAWGGSSAVTILPGEAGAETIVIEESTAPEENSYYRVRLLPR